MTPEHAEKLMLHMQEQLSTIEFDLATAGSKIDELKLQVDMLVRKMEG
jgi:hypothetical protein